MSGSDSVCPFFGTLVGVPVHKMFWEMKTEAGVFLCGSRGLHAEIA